MRALMVLGILGALWAVRHVRTIGADALPPIGRQRPKPPATPAPAGPRAPHIGATGPAPDPIWALGGKARWERWGSPDWEHVGDGRVVIDPAWVAANIEARHVPELGRTFTMHREFFGPFRAWVRDALAEGLITRDVRIDANRLARLSRRHGVYGDWPSSHAYGTAFDLDPSRYPESSDGGPVVRRLAQLAARHGIGWGGLLADPDPMHFELVEERAA